MEIALVSFEQASTEYWIDSIYISVDCVVYNVHLLEAIHDSRYLRIYVRSSPELLILLKTVVACSRCVAG